MSPDGVALAARGLGKVHRGRWVLRDCAFLVPAGRVAALVGGNGAGKSTLLGALAGVLAPDTGEVRVADGARVAFVAQDKPLYPHFSVREMLRLGRALNRVWDQGRAERWLERFGVPLGRACGKLSGGERAQVALALAAGSCPSVLLLDEPLSELDPLARREVTRELLTEVADTGMTVLVSTHAVAELDGVADYLLLLERGRLRVEGDIDDLLAAHLRYAGPRSATAPVPGEVVEARHAGGRSEFLLRVPLGTVAPETEPCWAPRPVTLEDLVLAHLTNARGGN
ncbi:ABC transporter ATP-binding protein [Amycolatopsis samaneae]|uniref:ATP-binding cassette domain-containing protein n=1 Tax=Amycolatopsis samaneae TaxID=664691 RepID=A0ABW5G9V3_9PSEU